MIVRRANGDDAAVIADIAERAYSVYVERIGRRPRPMDEDYAARIGSDDVFVADEGGRVCGLIVLVPERDHLLIENVAVDPSRQGAGIGRALLTHAERFAADHGFDRIRLYTNVAMVENQQMYRRLGYREDGRRVDKDFQRVFFSKALPANHA